MTLSGVVVFYKATDKVGGSLLVGACAIILAHNHPSGKLQPSPEDIHITKLTTDIAQQLGMKVHDHIIITDNGFYSFLEEGTMPK